ncbi:MAG: beta-galactosidase [Bryobacteraceae bacterium]
MRLGLALFLAGLILPVAGAAETPEFVQAVEFPYYAYPRSLWERELVWMKTVGIRTVEFSIPWNWHEVAQGDFDFTGRTSPRRDLIGFVRLLRRLEMRAWIRPLPPVKGWSGAGYPGWVAPDKKSAKPWLHELEKLLSTRTAAHGGAVEFAEGSAGFLELPPPPGPVITVSAQDSDVMGRCRQAVAAGHGSLLWEDVEDALYPIGWERAGSPVYKAGAVSLTGDERPPVAALRRNAALLRHWSALLAGMKPEGAKAVKTVTGKLPPGVSAVALVSRAPGVASAVSITNESGRPFENTLRAWDPFQKHVVEIENVKVAPHQSLWLPVNVTLGSGGLCGDCSAFSNAERIVYATAELQNVEFENGTLAMEFAAPQPAEVVLQLARKPSGPYLAGGHPTDYEYDDKTLRAKLKIPQGKGSSHQVRVALAIEAPEISAFFEDTKRLIIGQENIVSTSYSSEKLADRSRLRLPDGFQAKPDRKGPWQIDYALDVPPETLHGDWVNLAIEADGVPLGRARVQLFRPASIRFLDAIRLHFGAAELPVEPAVIPIDQTSGRTVNIAVRNNSPQIQSYQISPACDGFQFLPAKTELNSGAVMERTISFRVLPNEVSAGLQDWTLNIAGGTNLALPVRFLVIPRGQTVVWSADLDGDGSPEWILENQRARAVFATQDGGRWLEYVWKDSNLNVLPENGALAGTGPVAVHAGDGTLEFLGKDWKRTVRLPGNEAALTIEQTTPLPEETLQSGKRNEITFKVAREAGARATYTMSK